MSRNRFTAEKIIGILLGREVALAQAKNVGVNPDFPN
jgi:hypothetical protein